jgi:hypothetical protein
MQPPVSAPSPFVVNGGCAAAVAANPGTIIPDSDPSLDENLLNMLTADGDDDPMLSPSTAAKTLAGRLTQGGDTSLVLPNTVFSSKPVSNTDLGFLQLMSSGKSTVLSSNGLVSVSLASSSSSFPVTTSSRQIVYQISGDNRRLVPVTKQQQQQQQPRLKSFAFPRSTASGGLSIVANGSPVVAAAAGRQSLPLPPPLSFSFSTATASASNGTQAASSSQTLRSLLSTSLDSKMIRMTGLQPSKMLSLSNTTTKSQETPSSRPVLSSSTSVSLLTTTFTPHNVTQSAQRPIPSILPFSGPSSPVQMSESILPADISFTSESSSSRESNTLTLSLDDILAYADLPMDVSSSSRSDDRDSDLTSPGSVRSAVSEIEAVRGSEGDGGTMGAGECGGKFVCPLSNCGRTFEREMLLKRHLKMHAGECR